MENISNKHTKKENMEMPEVETMNVKIIDETDNDFIRVDEYTEGNKYIVVDWRYTSSIEPDTDLDKSSSSSFTIPINTKSSYEDICVCSLSYQKNGTLHIIYILIKDIIKKIHNESILRLFKDNQDVTMFIQINTTIKLYGLDKLYTNMNYGIRNIDEI